MNTSTALHVTRLVFWAVWCGPASALLAAPAADSSALRDAVTVDGIRMHQQALQDIADNNGGHRAAGTPGHDDSVNYVVQTLEDAGYEVTLDLFKFMYFEQLAPSVLDQTAPVFMSFVEGAVDGFTTMRFSGSGDVTAPVACVDVMIPPAATPNSSTSGCEVDDFAGFPAGAIAVVQRGSCSFAAKVTNAENAGASAVIIFNEGQPGRTDAFLGTLGSPGFAIPVVTTSYAIGETLCLGGVEVHAVVETISENRASRNVITNAPPDADGMVLIAGAHLDSVTTGPGIQDNGSGVAALLEIAVHMAELSQTPTGLRFAWWSGTENGLVGAQHYVTTLSPADVDQIKAYLNFDMVGSPNFVRFVFDGDESDFGSGAPEGSAAIEALFVDYFDQQGLATEPTNRLGEGDHLPFLAAGIPVGGLFTGDTGIKTADQASIYGGTAGAQYDPCYHLACDTFDNISLQALDEMADAMAHVLYSLTIDPCACVDGRVTICHHPPGRPDRRRTKTVGCPALQAHLGHGDSCGPCN